MTVAGWIIYVIIVAFIMGVVLYIASESQGKTSAMFVASGFIISIIILALMLWWFNNTAAGKRAFKTQESNFSDGIERIVKVYDATGNLITEYDGKFDITYDDDRILFDDENGKRHIVYYPTGTVIIDEK